MWSSSHRLAWTNVRRASVTKTELTTGEGEGVANPSAPSRPYYSYRTRTRTHLRRASCPPLYPFPPPPLSLSDLELVSPGEVVVGEHYDEGARGGAGGCAHTRVLHREALLKARSRQTCATFWARPAPIGKPTLPAPFTCFSKSALYEMV